MKKRPYSWHILTAIVLATLVAGYAYREFHRTKPSGSALKIERSVTAAELIAEFATDEKKATASCTGHALEVAGFFKESDLTHPTNPVIVMMDSSAATSLRFSLDSSFRADLLALKAGSPLRMKGVCIGYQADDLGLGADILFDRSIILTEDQIKP